MCKPKNVSEKAEEKGNACLVPDRPSIPDKIEMTGQVFNQIKYSIGKSPAETGGIMGMSGDVIDYYFYDSLPEGASGVTYSPNCGAINARLQRWTAGNIVYMGAIHSHPAGCTAPSYPDKQYAQRLLDHIMNFDKAKNYFYIPIAQTAADTGSFSLFSYIACYRDDIFSVEPIDLYVDGQKYTHDIDVPLKNFKRISELWPKEIMARKTVVIIGAGGARAYAEDLARCGVGNFVLFDGDTVAETNIATQGVFYSEIGMSKVEVIKEKLLDINPEANVVCVRKYLDDSITDDEFLKLSGEKCQKAIIESPADVLIGGLTDNFYANARASRLALKYGAPYIQAGIYPDGVAAEIVFSYPGVTPSCARCATSGRYKEYANGFVNDATSAGCSVFTTAHLNGAKGQISLMLLLHNTQTKYKDYLRRYATRNFAQINFEPDGALLPDVPLGGIRYFEQKPDHPDNGYEECPDCHGTGNLALLIGKIDDTRTIFG